MNGIGEKIRELRKKKGLSQEELAVFKSKFKNHSAD